MIEIGWRKRVISIDWSDTKIKANVTEDNVTKGDYYVHAYSEMDAAKYLSELKKAFKKSILHESDNEFKKPGRLSKTIQVTDGLDENGYDSDGNRREYVNGG